MYLGKYEFFFGKDHNPYFPCDIFNKYTKGINYEEKLGGATELVKDKISEIIDVTIYCNKTCFVRSVRGFNLESGEIEELTESFEREDEFLIEIRGKEGLEILKWMKNCN